ncbi:hypothetical protein BpHYR1_007863 [Brachionus plicatilis]|uniref:Uncharacterized protein n=1 Tax=Brachionus plicatilis TaxID=10195 RepID=A0A3M7STN6_BRAPC|nr:hypothetical protein BpHYR1_007863 [Brachionus plicatilis]
MQVSSFSRIVFNKPKDISRSSFMYGLYRNVIIKHITYCIPDDAVQYHLVSDATQSSFGYIINNKCAYAGQFNFKCAYLSTNTGRNNYGSHRAETYMR